MVGRERLHGNFSERFGMSLHHTDVLCTQSAQWTRCGREVKSLGTSCMATQLEPSHARHAVTRRGSSVETPWSPSGHCDVFFTEILRRFQKFHNALITLWERYLEWQGPNQFSVMYFYGFFFIPVAISFILCLQLSGVYIPLNTLHTLGFVKDLAVKKGENLVISSIRICDITCDS